MYKRQQYGSGRVIDKRFQSGVVLERRPHARAGICHLIGEFPQLLIGVFKGLVIGGKVASGLYPAEFFNLLLCLFDALGVNGVLKPYFDFFLDCPGA